MPSGFAAAATIPTANAPLINIPAQPLERKQNTSVIGVSDIWMILISCVWESTEIPGLIQYVLKEQRTTEMELWGAPTRTVKWMRRVWWGLTSQTPKLSSHPTVLNLYEY